MLTKERAEILSKILTSDQERTQNLLALEPNEALAKINGLGYDFGLEEIKEFGEALKTVSTEDDALDVDALENVAGGNVFTTATTAVVDAAKAVYNWGKGVGDKISSWTW